MNWSAPWEPISRACIVKEDCLLGSSPRTALVQLEAIRFRRSREGERMADE